MSLERLRTSLADRYRLERELGQGGMATVYLAHDLKHDRKVALKVLRPELAAVIGAERFLAEIKTTANLQHPHILALFDSGKVTEGHPEQGEGSSTVFYAMPYVEGESLRDRLTREKQLSIDDAVRIAKEVADALQYAHAHGVIHRDIKPENIMLHGGHALVADFGIALAAAATGGARMTETGMSLGTPHYMSPEQAMGERTLDARSDIYALGCVLYEMLTGEPPFSGPTAQSIVAKVMTEKPARIVARRDRVPANVEEAVLTALEKLPADRFASAAQFAEALGRSDFVPRHTREAPAATNPRARLVAALPWALVVLTALAAVWAWRRPVRGAGMQEIVVSSITLPDSAPLAFIGTAPYGIGRTALALSADGATLAYAAQRGSTTQIYLRPMDQDTVYPLAGTEGACCLFYSPDGAWLAFLVRDQLSKVRIGFAGSPIPITTANSFMNADWGDDGWIVVTDLQGRRSVRINAETGAREDLQIAMANPRVLPGARGILSNDSLYIPARHQRRGLLASGTDTHYAPAGFLTYAHRGQLWAVPFDLPKLRVTGEPLAVLPHLRTESIFGGAQYSFARSGLLVYAAGGTNELSRLVVRQQSGRVDTLPFEPALFGCLKLSPDGTRLTTRVADPTTGQWDLWIYDLTRGTRLRLTSTGGAPCPSWTPDGRVAYIASSGDKTVLYAQSATGRESPTVVATLTVHPTPSAPGWSPDGKRVALVVPRDSAGTDVVVIELDSGAAVRPVASAPALQWGGTFSPDGRWIAYSSSESGADEVYVQPYPPSGQRWRISRNGGEEPLWTRGGTALVYRIGQEWWTVRVTTAGQFSAGEPELLARGPWVNVSGVEYAVSSDGERLYLLAPAAGPATTTRLTVITNWFTMLTELSRRAGHD